MLLLLLLLLLVVVVAPCFQWHIVEHRQRGRTHATTRPATDVRDAWALGLARARLLCDLHSR